MRKVQIIADSTSDLHQSKRIDDNNVVNLFESRGVKVLPLGININDNLYLDGITINVKELFSLIKSTKTMPLTSAINPDTFINSFKEYIDQDMDILFIGLGSSISTTCNSAVLAGKEYESGRVYVVDGESLSTGTGIQVLRACDLRDQGLSASEIKDVLEKEKALVVTQFGINSLEFLYKGGRASGLAFYAARFLHIKPLLVMESNKLEAKEKIIGTTEKVCKRQFDKFFQEYSKGNVDKKYCFITHCLADTEVEYVKGLFKSNNIEIENIYITDAGCTISSHCGEHTLGILYSLITK
jgi:DegV family protein with EDD domain